MCDSVLFLISALLPLRGHFAKPVTGTDGVGVPTNSYGSGSHSGSKPPFEMQTRTAGPMRPTNPAPELNATDGQVFDRANMI
jgi:hypothetical protein